MPRFRKKPVIVEAVQWFPGVEVPDSCRVVEGFGVSGNTICKLAIDTLEGIMYAEPGDWIITGVHGEHYSCKPDIFEKTYEQIDEAK